jgi:type I restriction enzyme S subunit
MSAWPETALSEVLADAAPGFACGEDVEDGVLQFRMNNITTEGRLDLSKRRRVPRDYRNIDRFLVLPGDVLFNATNSPELVGKTAFFPGLEEPAVFSNHFLRLRPRDGKIDGRYLTRWLNLQFLHGRFKGMCRQWVNQATVGRDALLSLKVPLPPLPEQRRIAEILDKADALRAKRRAALAKLDALTQAIFLDMFGDPATSPKRWPHSALRDLGKVSTGGTPSSAKEGMFGGPIPFVTPGDLESAEPAKRSVTEAGAAEVVTVQAGATLVCCIGATIGKIGKATERSAFNQQINAVEWGDSVNPEYGYTVLRFFKPTIVAWGSSTTLPILKKSAFERIEVPVPPLGQQCEFAERTSHVDALRIRNRTALAQNDELFVALQSRAFQGEL